MAERVQVRPVNNGEGNRLLRVLRRGTGSVVTLRRGADGAALRAGDGRAADREGDFTSEGRVRDVIHNFNADGFESLYPRYKGGRPPNFSEQQRGEIKRIALSGPEDHGQPFSTWSLAKLAEYLLDEGVVEDISHERLRMMLREQGVSFQRVKTWKESTHPDYEAKKERVLDLYALADGKRDPRSDDPDEIICLDEFGPLNLQPHPGRGWGCRGGRGYVRRRR